MLKKILFIALTVCVLFTMNHAQNIEGVNARLDGWAGCGIPDDIGWVCTNPRNFVKYPDYLQGTAIIKPYWGTKEVYGRLILTKSLGSRVVAGIVANNNLLMGSDFYYRSISFMQAGGDFGLTPEDMTSNNLPAYPHIGASVKITDDINIGFLGFGEGIRKKIEYEIPSTTAKDSVRNRSYRNFGFILDANIGLGKIGFAPKISLCFPRIEGEDKSTTVSDVTTTTDYESDKGLKLTVGSAAWFVGLKHPIVGGIYFIQEQYQFTMERNIGQTSDSSFQSKPFTNNILFIFLGTEIHFGDGFMFTPEIDLEFVRLHLDGLENETALHDTVIAPNMYTLRLGLEKEIKNLRFLDRLTPRAGMVYKYGTSKITLEDSTGKEDVTVNPVETNNDKFYQNRGMKLAAGLGITKGRATLDVSADLLNWSGTLITGMKAAMFTLTVDIGRNARYKEDSDTEPATESFQSETPAPQSEPDTAEPTDDFGVDIE